MEDKRQNLEEQDHPLKNTDNAFVQVGKNGEPLVPRLSEDQPASNDQQDNGVPLRYDKP